MTATTPIFDSMRLARFTDPTTSHMAIPYGQRVRTVQMRVLEILTKHGPLTHDEVRRFYIAEHGMTPGSSGSSIRSRVNELHEVGGVRAVDREGRTPSGRAATRWDIHREEQPHD